MYLKNLGDLLAFLFVAPVTTYSSIMYYMHTEQYEYLQRTKPINYYYLPCLIGCLASRWVFEIYTECIHVADRSFGMPKIFLVRGTALRTENVYDPDLLFLAVFMYSGFGRCTSIHYSLLT